MKVLAFLLCLTLPPMAHAQLTRGDAIKATTTVHGDGTRTTLVVDPEAQSAEETLYNAAGKMLSKTVYPLDPANQAIGAITYDAKGGIVAKASYKRDGMGRISEETITSAAGQFLRRRVYSYSAQNKISRVDEYDANGNLLVAPKPGGSSKKPRR